MASGHLRGEVMRAGARGGGTGALCRGHSSPTGRTGKLGIWNSGATVSFSVFQNSRAPVPPYASVVGHGRGGGSVAA